MTHLTLVDGGLHWPAPGFDPGEGNLPAERVDVARERRELAALLVLAIGRGATPEDLVHGIPAEAREAFVDDPLEREEALAHVDVLLEALAPRLEVLR